MVSLEADADWVARAELEVNVDMILAARGKTQFIEPVTHALHEPRIFGLHERRHRVHTAARVDVQSVLDGHELLRAREPGASVAALPKVARWSESSVGLRPRERRRHGPATSDGQQRG